MDERTTDPPAPDAPPSQPSVPRTGEDGNPVYDQEFFLALARCGKDVWNLWRAEHGAVEVTFEGIDFTLPANAVSFRGFVFGARACFRDCRFGDGFLRLDPSISAFQPGMAEFADARFGHDADFSNATLGRLSNLSGAVFGDLANFSGASIGFGSIFSNSAFGPGAKFFATQFRGRIGFRGASFGPGASFEAAQFGHGVDFAASIFEDNASFGGAAVFGQADLSFATFGSAADFSEVTFGKQPAYEHVASRSILNEPFNRRADFTGATFGARANFTNAVFEGLALFGGAMFGPRAKLDQVIFHANVDFETVSQSAWRNHLLLMTESWTEVPRDRAAQIEGERKRLRVDVLNAISFANSTFEAAAKFNGRSFGEGCIFSNTAFRQPPSFTKCQGFNHIDFYGSQIDFCGRIPRPSWLLPVDRQKRDFSIRNWTTESDVAVKLRALRRLATESDDHDLERDLYIQERKAERGILFALYWRAGWRARLSSFIIHCLWVFVIWLYSFLADYGRSFVRPLFALAISVPLFWWAYATALIPPTNPTKLPDFRRAAWAFAISNAVPFVGALTLERDVKLTLLCGDRPIDLQQSKQMNDAPVCVPIPGRRFQLLALAQSIFSALCIFFAGLALRNYFKLK